MDGQIILAGKTNEKRFGTQDFVLSQETALWSEWVTREKRQSSLRMAKKKESFEREGSQWGKQQMSGMERWVSYYRLLFAFGSSGKSQGDSWVKKLHR